MSEKDFECILCGQRFTMLYGDLIIQEDLICETCQEEMLQLNGEARREQIANRLTATMPEREPGFREALGNRIAEKLNKKSTNQESRL